MARERFARHSIGEDLIKGAIAGAAATWVMGKMSAVIHRVGRRADEVRGAGTGYGAAVETAAGAIGRTLGGKDREPPGSAVHWALGIGSGAVYAVLRRRLAGISRTAGVGFGTVFWAAIDEGVVPALGLGRAPRAFPWRPNARGLAGHLTFGTVTDGALRLLDAVV